MTTAATKSSKPKSTSKEGTNDRKTTDAKHSTSTTNADKDKDESDEETDKETDDERDTSPPEIDDVEKPDLTKPDLPTAPDLRDKSEIGTADESGEVTNLSSLSEDDIRKILDRSNLFKGIKLRGEESPESTRYLVDPAKTKFNWSTLNEASAVATTVFSERTSRLVEQGWTKTATNFSSPWVSGGIEVSKNETHASQSTKRYLYTTSSYVLKKMKVTIDKDVAAKNLTKGFLDDVKSAVNEPAVEKQLERLREVFKKYGHVFLTSVIIGTSMVTSLKQEQTSTATIDVVEKSLKAKVAAKWGAFSGGVSHGSGSTTESGSTSDDQYSSLTFTSRGGNNAFSTNPGKWLGSTGDSTLWTVIAMEEVVPLTDLILLHDKDLGEKVNQCVPRPLIGRFTFEGEALSSPKISPLRMWQLNRPAEEWMNQGWYWLGSSTQRVHLLVKETEEGALGLIEKTETLNSWDNLMHSEVMAAFWSGSEIDRQHQFKWIVSSPVPSNQEEYVALGHIHGDSTSVPNGLRAVRKDLVVKAVPQYTPSPILTVEFVNGVTEMGWPVVPNELSHGEPALAETAHFYYVKPEGDVPVTRDMALRVPMCLLKESAILLTNTMDDAGVEYERKYGQ